jgi:hypothetical protein
MGGNRQQQVAKKVAPSSARIARTYFLTFLLTTCN